MPRYKKAPHIRFSVLPDDASSLLLYEMRPEIWLLINDTEQALVSMWRRRTGVDPITLHKIMPPVDSTDSE